MKTLVRVLCQYFNENGKPKMGQEFEFYANSDIFMYDEDKAIEAIKLMIAEHDKEWAGHHEYRSHELVFFEPTKLETFDKFYNFLTAEVDKDEDKWEEEPIED